MLNLASSITIITNIRSFLEENKTCNLDPHDSTVEWAQPLLGAQKTLNLSDSKKTPQTVKLILDSKTHKLPWTLGLLKGTAPLWWLGWQQKKCAGSSTCICKCCRGSYTIFVRAWIRKPSAGSRCQGKCKNSLGGSCANRVQASGSHRSWGTPKSANSFIFVFSPRLWGLL